MGTLRDLVIKSSAWTHWNTRQGKRDRRSLLASGGFILSLIFHPEDGRGYVESEDSLVVDMMSYIFFHIMRFSVMKFICAFRSKIFILSSGPWLLLPPISLFETFFYSKHDYGIQLWGCASDSNIQVTQRYQNKVLKCIVNSPWHVRFEVFTAMTMKNSVFWDVTPWGSCTNRRFGGT
jgi:hypothetical protein